MHNVASHAYVAETPCYRTKYEQSEKKQKKNEKNEHFIVSVPLWNVKQITQIS